MILLFTPSFAKFTLNIFYIQGTLLDAHHYRGKNDSLPAWSQPRSALRLPVNRVQEQFRRRGHMAASSLIMMCSSFPKGRIKLMSFKRSLGWRHFITWDGLWVWSWTKTLFGFFWSDLLGFLLAVAGAVAKVTGSCAGADPQAKGPCSLLFWNY